MPDQEELKKEISKRVFLIAEQTLNYADLIIVEENTYKKFRGRVLSICNDTVRGLDTYIDDDIESQ